MKVLSDRGQTRHLIRKKFPFLETDLVVAVRQVLVQTVIY
jgi:hypothetical protein